MNKIFGVCFNIQEEEVRKYCYGKCDKVMTGAILDDILKTLIPCREETCPYEEKRMELGKLKSTGETVWLRKLKKEEK